MQFPLRLKGNRPVQWLSIGVILLGLVAIGFTLAGHPAATNLLYAYLISFVAYTWASAFLK
jgi:hypothetical protein